MSKIKHKLVVKETDYPKLYDEIMSISNEHEINEMICELAQQRLGEMDIYEIIFYGDPELELPNFSFDDDYLDDPETIKYVIKNMHRKKRN